MKMLPLKEYLESLPKKRMGAGCLLFNAQGQVLLVRPTYKPGWEIPGGVVELNESPLECCQRELAEELGLARALGGLLVVDYNHAVGEKTEALMFIFDGGVLTSVEIESIRLLAGELSEYRFFPPESLPPEMSPALRRRVQAAGRQARAGTGAYMQDESLNINIDGSA